MHPQIDLGPPTGRKCYPQTQLFGRGGIAPELTPGQINRREKGWDKYHGHISMLPKSYGHVSDIQEKQVPPVFPGTVKKSEPSRRKVTIDPAVRAQGRHPRQQEEAQGRGPQEGAADAGHSCAWTPV